MPKPCLGLHTLYSLSINPLRPLQLLCILAQLLLTSKVCSSPGPRPTDPDIQGGVDHRGRVKTEMSQSHARLWEMGSSPEDFVVFYHLRYGVIAQSQRGTSRNDRRTVWGGCGFKSQKWEQGKFLPPEVRMDIGEDCSFCLCRSRPLRGWLLSAWRQGQQHHRRAVTPGLQVRGSG